MADERKEKTGTKDTAPEEIGDFLVLSCPSENITSGTKLVVLNVAKTQAKAVEHINDLTSTMPEYVCVVEKNSLFSRKPQIVVKKL